MPDEMIRIVKCKQCGQLEYYGEMRWLNGRCACRNCYKAQWQDTNHKLYTWKDLDGERPTKEQYTEQFIQKLADDDGLCDYCKYESDCPKGVCSYGGEPSYPPCADDENYSYLNMESIEEAIEEEIE